jgi:hypothetical protein
MPGDRALAHRAAALRDATELDAADLAALTAAGQPEVPAPPKWVGTYRAGLLAKRRPVRHAHRLWRNRSGRWPAVMRSGSRG